MALFSFLKKTDKHSGSSAVIFDIGSGSVGGALVAVRKNQGPEILYGVRKPTTLTKQADFNQLVSATLETLKTVALDIEKNGIVKMQESKLGGKHINDVLCFFASPWYLSQTKTLKVTHKEPKAISKSFIDKFIVKAEKDFQDFISKAGGAKQTNTASPVIEKSIIKTALNGYETDDPYEKKALRVEAALYLSTISGTVDEKIRAVLGQIFNARHVSFHTFGLASFVVLRDVYESTDNFLIIDVSGEVTDVTVVRDNVLLETASFPLGKHFLLRKVANQTKKTPEEAHSLIRMYLAEKKTEKESALIEKTLTAAQQEWLKPLQKTLSDLSHELVLPKTVFLTTTSDLAPWFEQAVKNEEFSQTTFTTEPFMIVMPRAGELCRLCAYNREQTPDMFLLLEALFFHKFARQ